MIQLFMCCVLGADPGIVFTVNQTEIRQCDHLVVKSVISNRTDVGVTIQDDRPDLYGRIRYERKSGSSWVHVPTMAFRRFVGRRSAPGPDPLLDANATYAEYETIFQDKEDRFVFDSPGQIELRAVAKVAGQPLESNTVAITIKPRVPSMIGRIEEAKKSAAILGGQWFTGTIPDNLVALEDVGGNIGQGVKNLKLIDRIVRGEEKTGDNVFEYIRQRMDPVDAEVGFMILGHHYFRARDYANLAKVVEALPDNSVRVWEWSATLEFQRLKAIPQVVVPQQPSRR